MQFKGANKKTIVAVRSYQLTQKEKKAEFKALESAVVTKNDKGEVNSSNFRCADMDKLVPELLGVSSPILENVIFCHQEDVNWPLDEASVLKKKFDDIFASTRYTMALENIRKFRKTQADELKKYQVDLGKLEEKTKQSKKVRKKKIFNFKKFINNSCV